MSDEYKNVRRIQTVDRTSIVNQLKTKMLGFVADDSHLAFKSSGGTTYFFPSEGADASFGSMKLTGFGGDTGFLAIDAVGNVILSSMAGSGGASMSTGATSFGGITINTDITKFNVGEIKGYFIDNSNPENTIVQYKEFSAQTAITPTYLTTNNATYIAIGVDGTIIQSSSEFLPEQYRQYIVLGTVVHSNKTNINAINNLVSTSMSPVAQLNDLMESVGDFIVTGNVISTNGTNLHINKSGGNIFKHGSNFVNNVNSPHILTLAGLTAPDTIRYRTQDGDEDTNTNVIDPSRYDLNGTKTTITSTGWTVQRVFLFSSNLLRIQYGQKIYATKADALNGIGKDTFITEQNISENGIHIAYIVVDKTCNDLTNTTKAEIIQVGKFGTIIGSASSSVDTLQTAYDNSAEPEIIINDTLGAVTIDQGVATTNLLELTDNANDKTYIAMGSDGIDIHPTTRITKGTRRFFNEYNGSESIYYSYDQSTRTFTFNSGGASTYWIDGVASNQPSNTNTITHSNVANIYFIYINDSNQLTSQTTPWDLSANIVPLLAVYWTGSVAIPIFECHNKSRDRDWHANAHTSLGTQAQVDGFTLTNINQDTATTDAQLLYGIGEGWLKDEDIKLTLDTLASGGSSYNILYRGTPASTVLAIANKTFPFSWTTSGYIQYNDVANGILTPSQTGKWVNYFIVAIPAKSSNAGAIVTNTSHAYRYLFVAGQASHNNLASAQAEEFWSLNMGDLANFSEWVPLYRITYKTNASYTTTGKSIVDEYKRYYIARASLTGTASTTTTHNSLVGRDASASHPITSITGTAGYLASFDGSGNGTSIAKSTFALASHNHAIGDIIGSGQSVPYSLGGILAYDQYFGYSTIAGTGGGTIGKLTVGGTMTMTDVSTHATNSSVNHLIVNEIDTGSQIYLNLGIASDGTKTGSITFKLSSIDRSISYVGTDLFARFNGGAMFGDNVLVGTTNNSLNYDIYASRSSKSVSIVAETSGNAYHAVVVAQSMMGNIALVATGSTDTYTHFGATVGGFTAVLSNMNKPMYIGTIPSEPLHIGTTDIVRATYTDDGRYTMGSADPEGLAEFECSTATWQQMTLTDNRTHATDVGAELGFYGKFSDTTKYSMGALRCNVIATATNQTYMAMSVYGENAEQDIVRFYPVGMELLSTNTGSQTPELRLYNNANTFYTAFKSAGVSSNYTFTLPNGYGTTGQVLTSNGSGTMSWTSASAKPTLTKTIIIESPVSGDSFTIFKVDTPANVTVQEVLGVITGAGTSVAYTLYRGADRNSGSQWATSTASSKTSGTVASMSGITLYADNWIWIDIGTVTGTITSIAVDIRYTEN